MTGKLEDSWEDEASKADFSLQKGEPKAAKSAKEALRKRYKTYLSSGGEPIELLQTWLDQSFVDWGTAVAKRGPVAERQAWRRGPLAILPEGERKGKPPTRRDSAAKVASEEDEDEEEEGAVGGAANPSRPPKEPPQQPRPTRPQQITPPARVAGAYPPGGPWDQPGTSQAGQRQDPPKENAEYAGRLRLKAQRSDAVKTALAAVCTAMGITATEEQEAAGELNWGQVLAEMGEYTISSSIVEELKMAYEYQGFDAKLVAQQMAAKGVSPLHAKEGTKAGGYMDRLTLVVIGLMRGANLDKVRKGMKEQNRAKLDVLIKHYGLVSKPVDTAAITLPRVIATFPGLAMDVLKVMEMGPVRHTAMTGLVENYPRQMMFSAFPSLIPRDLAEVTEVLLAAYLLYQHQVSLVINKDYAKWDVQKQQTSLEGFARAALDSNYVTQRQRVLRLVEEGWLEVKEGKVVLSAAVATPLAQAAALYRTRK
uniref:Nucleoprotein n=1 Tax=Shoal Cavern virus TaxID=3139881 RepID=A0AAN0LJ89_9VIRU